MVLLSHWLEQNKISERCSYQDALEEVFEMTPPKLNGYRRTTTNIRAEMPRESSDNLHMSDVLEVINNDQEDMVLVSEGALTASSGAPGADGRPYVEIVEQPATNEARFRYKCEGRSAGSIPGCNSTKDHKTSPAIKVHNYKGRAVVVVSCVTKEKPYKPHPHNLVGKEGCKDGICTQEVASSENQIIQFPNLGIQCVKKNEVENSLRQREKKKLDPFQTGFEHATQPSSIDLNVVRLCFQVFLPGSSPRVFDKVLTPVVSSPIYDKKSVFDLQIYRLSHASAPVGGGLEMILLCEKVTKEDIEIHFIEERNGEIVWSAHGEFQPIHVHKQVAITFRTPSYVNKEVEDPVSVQIKLYRPSDGVYSKPVDFTLTPLVNSDLNLKRKKPKTGDVSGARALHQQMTMGDDSKRHLRASPDPSIYPVKQEPADHMMYGGNLPVYGSVSPHSVSALSPQMPVGRTPSPLDYESSPGPYSPSAAYQGSLPAPRVGAPPAAQSTNVFRNLQAGGTCSYGSTSPYRQEMLPNEPGLGQAQQSYTLPMFSSLSPVSPSVATSVASSISQCPMPGVVEGAYAVFGVEMDKSLSPRAPEASPVTDITAEPANLNLGLNSTEIATIGNWCISDQMSISLSLTDKEDQTTDEKQ